MASIVGVQCFLARAALGWSMCHLARAAEVSPHSVAHFESGGTATRATTAEAIRRALEKAGVIFIDANDGGPGARLGKG
jgi:transcriptional regulator with XRE-family HTH domain